MYGIFSDILRKCHCTIGINASEVVSKHSRFRNLWRCVDSSHIYDIPNYTSTHLLSLEQTDYFELQMVHRESNQGYWIQPWPPASEARALTASPSVSLITLDIVRLKADFKILLRSMFLHQFTDKICNSNATCKKPEGFKTKKQDLALLLNHSRCKAICRSRKMHPSKALHQMIN